MSEKKYLVRVAAECNMQGADWEEEIDLLEFGWSEEQAIEIVEALARGEDPGYPELDDDMKSYAIEMSGFNWGYGLAKDSQKLSEALLGNREDQ